MTTNYHTPPADGAEAKMSVIRAPLGELDQAITNQAAAISALDTRVDNLEADMPVPSGNPTEYLDGDGNWTVPAGTGASVDGHVIQDEGVDMPQRAKLNFVGAGVTVTNEAGGTQVDISGGGHAIEDEGTPITQRSTLNFTGAGVTVTDDAGKTKVDIPGGVTDHGALNGLEDDDHAQYHNDARGDARYPRKHTGKTAAPTASDDSSAGYALDDRWLDETNDKEYVAVDVSVGAAVWKETTSTGGGATSNLLLNGGLDFARRQDPGTYTTIANDKYAADRWRVCRENNDVQYIRSSAIGETGLTSYYFGTLKKITSTGKIHMCQPIKAVNSVPLRGKNITFQVKLKASASKTLRIGIIELQNAGSVDVIPATLVTAWGANTVDPTLGANLAIITGAVSCVVTTSWQLFSVTVTVPSNSKNILPAIWTDSQFAANDTFSYAELDLHIGSATQDWAPRHSEEELQLLQHYYWKTFGVDAAPAQNAGVAGALRFPAIAAGAVTMRVMVRLPVSMRATPTLTFFNPSAANANPRDSNAFVDGTIVSSTLSPDCLFLNITGNASTSINNAMDVHVTAGSEL